MGWIGGQIDVKLFNVFKGFDCKAVPVGGQAGRHLREFTIETLDCFTKGNCKSFSKRSQLFAFIFLTLMNIQFK